MKINPSKKYCLRYKTVFCTNLVKFTFYLIHCIFVTVRLLLFYLYWYKLQDIFCKQFVCLFSYYTIHIIFYYSFNEVLLCSFIMSLCVARMFFSLLMINKSLALQPIKGEGLPGIFSFVGQAISLLLVLLLF